MKNCISITITFIIIILSTTFSNADSFTQMVGDDDNFGGSPYSDTRSLEEQNATNGAQYTDWYNNIYQRSFIFNYGTPITEITQATLEVNECGIEDADDGNGPEYVDIQINIEGYNVSQAFDDIYGDVQLVTFDLFSLLGASALEDICSDGIVTMDFLNAGLHQEMYVIDWVTLTVENATTTSSSTTTSIESASTTTSIGPITTTTSLESSTTTTTTSESTFTISGTVTGVIGSNVPLMLEGASSETVYTDFRKYYEFTDLTSGYYIITPTLEGYDFDPPSREIPNLTGDLRGIDFESRKAMPCPAEKIYEEGSEELRMLRYLRDNLLRKTLTGKELIKLYYQWSPILVRMMQDDEEFKEDVREMIEEILPLIGEPVE